MPSPPITVGELTDVPTPESPINAQYMQEVAHRIVHRFASVPAMNAWPAANGSIAWVPPFHYARASGQWFAFAYQGDVAIADTNLQNQINALQAQLNTAPLGILARTTGAQTLGIVAATELCRVTFTADPARWYRTTAYVLEQETAAVPGYQGVAAIWDSGTTAYAFGVHQMDVGGMAPFALSVVESGLSGPIMRRLMVAAGGGGSINVQVGGSYTAPYIAVEDMGAV